MIGLILLLISFTAQATGEPMSAPELLTPLSGEETVIFHPHFDWEPVAGADAYHIQVAGDAGFEKMVDDDTVNAIVQWYAMEKRLAPGAYFWRVRAEKEDGAAGAWSEARILKVIEASRIFNIAPETTVEEIRSLAAEAASAPSARIVFEAKDYYFDPGYEGNLFEWKNEENIIIDGGGARIHLMDPSSQIAKITHCRRIMIGGFYFYHEPCPLSYAELISADPVNGTVDVKLLGGYDGVNYPREVNQFFLYAVDPTNPRRLHPQRPGHTYLTPGLTENLGEGRRRYIVREKVERPGLSQFQPGDRLIVCYRRWPQNWVSQCEDFTFFDLRGGYSEGSLYMGGGNKDMKFLGLVNPPPEEYFPSTGTWVTGNDRRGPWVEGCRWEAMSDDGPNFTGNTYMIEEIVSEDTFRLRSGVSWQNSVWLPGDQLIFWDPATGIPIAETTVVKAEGCEPGGSPLVQVYKAIQGVKPGGEVQQCTQVYNLSTQNRQMVLRGNTLTGGRRFGFFVKAVDALIEKNHFTGQSSSALFFEAEPSGWEGLVSWNIVVQDNIIEDCGNNEWSVINNRAGIHINTWRCNPIMAETPWIGNRGFVIRRNTILDREGIGIGVDNAEDVMIKDNIITNKCKDRFLYGGAADNAAIRVFERTRDIRVEANELTDSREPGGKAVIQPVDK